VLYYELTNKGTDESPTMYFEGALYNGVGFDVYLNGQLELEVHFKDGETNGLFQRWDPDGQLKQEVNYKDGNIDGLIKNWDENGQRID
jgi:antitoxin component YwqK of YwqJK toxin-antitoxin module